MRYDCPSYRLHSSNSDPSCTVDCGHNTYSCPAMQLGSHSAGYCDLNISCNRYDDIDLASYLDQISGLTQLNPITESCVSGIRFLCNPYYTNYCYLTKDKNVTYNLTKHINKGLYTNIDYSVSFDCMTNNSDYICNYNHQNHTNYLSDYNNDNIIGNNKTHLVCKDASSCYISCDHFNCTNKQILCPTTLSNDEISCTLYCSNSLYCNNIFFCISSGNYNNLNINGNNINNFILYSHIESGFINIRFVFNNITNVYLYYNNAEYSYGYTYFYINKPTDINLIQSSDVFSRYCESDINFGYRKYFKIELPALHSSIVSVEGYKDTFILSLHFQASPCKFGPCTLWIYFFLPFLCLVCANGV